MTAAGGRSGTRSSRSSGLSGRWGRRSRSRASTAWWRRSGARARTSPSPARSAQPSNGRSGTTPCPASTWCWTRRLIGGRGRCRWRSDRPVQVTITFLSPHLRVAGGVRAILTYADRLAARGHEVTLLVPARSRVRAWSRNRSRQGPDWMPGLRARVRWVPDWTPAVLPDGDALIATAWQSAQPVDEAPDRCGRKFYFIQHYESLYHGAAASVDRTYQLPLRKIVISSWLGEVMSSRFGSSAEVIVTPVDAALFHRVPVEHEDGLLRVLMLHHE